MLPAAGDGLLDLAHLCGGSVAGNIPALLIALMVVILAFQRTG